VKHFLFFRDSECSQVEKKIKRNKVKKKDGVHSAKAKRSRFKTSQKKDSVAKDDTKMAVYGEKADNRSLESALMKKKKSANLKQKLAQTIKTSMSIRNNANQLEVHVSGHFQNSKSGKSYWIVVFGNNGQTWLIKPEIVTGYLQCLLTDIATNIDILHCETYCEINIRKHEYGSGSLWKCVQKNNGKPPQTIKRLSFVYSCDTTDEKIGKQD